MNKISILDFGSQYTHLIATRFRRLGVYSQILDPKTPLEELKDSAAIVLSGGPSSVYEPGSPTVDPAIFTLGKPILGICYGHQLITHLLGGRVEPGKGQGAEFGKAAITVRKNEGLLKSFHVGEETAVWMSHGDRVTQLPAGFEILASSADDAYSAVGDLQRKFFGIQFHTEVVHTTRGAEMLANFLDLAGIQRDWDLGDFLQNSLSAIREQVGTRNVFMLISGGVDSTVAYVLLAKALGPDRVYGLFVDTGFMREGERDQVETALRSEGIQNLHVVDASQEFFTALEGVAEPEKKREIIGRVFLEVQARVSRDLKLNPAEWMLGQGTIYPDTIESGGTQNSSKIKTHHNRVPEIEALIKEGRVIEPIKDLYKDEVREVGEKLGLPVDLVWRHPFPGPGLAVRILCAQEEDWAPDHAKLEEEINAFLVQKQAEGHCANRLTARTLPIKSVGVQGDFRTYRHPVVLSGEATWAELAALAPALTNRFHELNRVLYACSSTAIEAIHLTPGTLTPARTQRLQKADKIAMLWLKEIGHSRAVWQMPTVLLPVSVNEALPAQNSAQNNEQDPAASLSSGLAPAKESLVLRPVVSEEAMTAHFAELPMPAVQDLAKRLMEDSSISAVFYDITNKPPATIEWE